MLIKFCKLKESPFSGCRTIKFGTPSYFRDADPLLHTTDVHENKDRTVIINSFGNSDHKETAEIFDSLLGEGPHGRNICIDGCSVEASSPDCLIWCCSIHDGVDGAVRKQQIRRDKDAHFGIPDTDSFARYLTQLIKENLRLEMFCKEAQERIRKLPRNGISIHVVHGAVDYVDCKENIIFRDELTTYQSDMDSYFRRIFVKPKRDDEKVFQNDHEYRFSFHFTDRNGMVFPVNPYGLIVPCPDILAHVVKVELP